MLLFYSCIEKSDYPPFPEPPRDISIEDLPDEELDESVASEEIDENELANEDYFDYEFIETINQNDYFNEIFNDYTENEEPWNYNESDDISENEIEE